MTQAADIIYLDDLNARYAASEDPWHLRAGWYAERKVAAVLAVLPRARFTRSLQVGLSGGGLTRGLAQRSESLLAITEDRDLAEAAVRRTSHISNVSVRRVQAIVDWHSQSRYDLIVLDEIGYRSGAASWARVCHAVAQSLASDGAVLACHWRHQVAGRELETETVHGMLDSILGLHRHTHLYDADFIVDMWMPDARSVATRDGLR